GDHRSLAARAVPLELPPALVAEPGTGAILRVAPGTVHAGLLNGRGRHGALGYPTPFDAPPLGSRRPGGALRLGYGKPPKGSIGCDRAAARCLPQSPPASGCSWPSPPARWRFAWPGPSALACGTWRRPRPASPRGATGASRTTSPPGRSTSCPTGPGSTTG